jgi:hypothetical protein
MIILQEIGSPRNGKITNHDFYDYDPLHAFDEANSLKYLSEDLLQCYFPEDDVKVDLGWYGDILANTGEFRIYIIESENWEYPVKVIYSKSVEEIKTLLNNILQYYASK